MIDIGTFLGALVTHYDCLQDSQYCNQSLVRNRKVYMTNMGGTKSLAKKIHSSYVLRN